MWQRLRDGLGPDCVLMANVRLTDEDKDHEADLVVLMPEAGVLVLEVKGGAVWHDEGGWWIRRGEVDERCWPVDQARDAKYAIRRYVESDPRWGGRGHVAWSHGVVTPHSEFGNDFAVPDLPRWALHDKHEQDDLAERVRTTAGVWRTTTPRPTTTTSSWSARSSPGATTVVRRQRRRRGAGRRGGPADPGADGDPAGDPAAAPRRGARGSRQRQDRAGAAEGQGPQPRRGRAARPSGWRCCATRSGWRSTSSARTQTWKRQHRPAFVGTYEDLGRSWGDRDGHPRRQRLLGAPAAGADGREGRRAGARAPLRRGRRRRGAGLRGLLVGPVLGALRDEERGRGVRLLGREPAALRPLRPAAGAAGPAGARPQPAQHPADLRDVRAAGAEPDAGPRRRRRRRCASCRPPPTTRSTPPTTRSTRCSRRAGTRRKVALLTTGHRHPVQTEQVERHGPVGYWRSFWDGEDVFYGHVLGCKGLERACVVLCVNEAGERDRARERLYVGMSRATDVLVVVGDPEVVRRVGGDEVARRLGIG